MLGVPPIPRGNTQKEIWTEHYFVGNAVMKVREGFKLDKVAESEYNIKQRKRKFRRKVGKLLDG
jgi:hypothetical protein